MRLKSCVRLARIVLSPLLQRRRSLTHFCCRYNGLQLFLVPVTFCRMFWYAYDLVEVQVREVVCVRARARACVCVCVYACVCVCPCVPS